MSLFVMMSALQTYADNEIYVDRDIMVMANPEIAQLPNWVVALIAAGAVAAALSTAAGLLLVISSSISPTKTLYKRKTCRESKMKSKEIFSL